MFGLDKETTEKVFLKAWEQMGIKIDKVSDDCNIMWLQFPDKEINPPYLGFSGDERAKRFKNSMSKLLKNDNLVVYYKIYKV